MVLPLEAVVSRLSVIISFNSRIRSYISNGNESSISNKFSNTSTYSSVV